jgi:sulfur carrier protein
MKVVLRNPRREVEMPGRRRVSDVLRELAILPETVLVIRGDELLTSDARLGEDDTIELRPVMSGGALVPAATVEGESAESRAAAGTSSIDARGPDVERRDDAAGTSSAVTTRAGAGNEGQGHR